MSTVYNKVAVGNTTLIDLSQDTVSDASHIRNGYVGHLNDGTQVTGNYTGADMPIFTVVWDNDSTSIISASCNKTLAECYALLDVFSDNYTSGAIVKETNQGQTFYFEKIAYSTDYEGSNTYCTYTVMHQNFTDYDLNLYSDGTVTYTSPSVRKRLLNPTQNGFYDGDIGIVEGVTVNVSQNLQAKTNINPSTSSQTIQPDSGYDGLSSVQINAMPSMTLPTAATSSSSGTSQGTITPTSSAQYLNIPTGYNAAAAYYTIAAASGGASNIVTGTFTGTTTGAVLEVATGYTGNGHPIRISIAPKDGAYNSSSTFYSTVQRYAICSYAAFACNPDSVASYQQSPGDTMGVLCYYKSSSSNAASYTAYGNSSQYILNQNLPIADRSTCVRFPDKSTMKVYIASNSYGFMANIEYQYIIIYSS